MHIAPPSLNTQESKMIKSIVIAISLTTLTLSSAFAQNKTDADIYRTSSEAQQNDPNHVIETSPPALNPAYATHRVTRAEVRHELEELEAAGYDPAQGDDSSYPADLQAAEAKVAAKHRAERDAAMSASQNRQTKPTP
jgi:hypothetical protein